MHGIDVNTVLGVKSKLSETDELHEILTTWVIQLDELDHMNEIGPYGLTCHFSMNFEMDGIGPYV
jgi:hypothetical protein